MAAHHHGYTWLGSGFELAKDGLRRPIHPEWRTTRVVPLEIAHWLLKPVSFVEGTFTDPEGAARWFGERMREHASAFCSPNDREAEVMARRLKGVVEAVADGQDAIGGWHLTGQRFLSVCLVGCSPHRARPEYPCPL